MVELEIQGTQLSHIFTFMQNEVANLASFSMAKLYRSRLLADSLYETVFSALVGDTEVGESEEIVGTISSVRFWSILLKNSCM